MAWLAGRSRARRAHFERAIATLDATGRTHASARVTARLGEVDYFEERHERGDRADGAGLRRAVERRDRRRCRQRSPPSSAGCTTSSATSSGRAPGSSSRSSSPRGSTFPSSSPRPSTPRPWCSRRSAAGRRRGALLRHALQLALDNGLSGAALRAYNNLITFFEFQDRYDEALVVATSGLELARRTGDKRWESGLLANTLAPLFFAGRWDELLEHVADFAPSSGVGIFIGDAGVAAVVHAAPGRPRPSPGARRLRLGAGELTRSSEPEHLLVLARRGPAGRRRRSPGARCRGEARSPPPRH